MLDHIPQIMSPSRCPAPEGRASSGSDRHVDGARPDNQYAPVTEARSHHPVPHATQARYSAGTTATVAMRGSVTRYPAPRPV